MMKSFAERRQPSRLSRSGSLAHALAGVLHSSGMREAVIDSPARAAAIRAAHAKAAPVTRNPGKTKIALRPGDRFDMIHGFQLLTGFFGSKAKNKPAICG